MKMEIMVIKEMKRETSRTPIQNLVLPNYFSVEISLITMYVRWRLCLDQDGAGIFASITYGGAMGGTQRDLQCNKV